MRYEIPFSLRSNPSVGTYRNEVCETIVRMEESRMLYLMARRGIFRKMLKNPKESINIARYLARRLKCRKQRKHLGCRVEFITRYKSILLITPITWKVVG